MTPDAVASPGAPPGVAVTAEAAVRALAVWRLAAGSPGPIAVDSIEELATEAQRHQVIAFVRNAITDGAVPDATNDDLRAIERRCQAAAGATLGTHAAMLDAVGRLRAVGIDPIVLKGCATAFLDHDRSHHRASSDVDLLVPPGSLPTVLAAGIGTPPAFRRARWQQQYAKSTAIADHHATEIDLHQYLAPGYPGLRIPHRELTATLDRFEIAGVELRALDGPNRLLHAAIHAARPVGLHSLRDVPQLVLGSGVDWEQTVWRARRWQVEATVAAGIQRAWDAFPLDDHPLVAWARVVRGRRRERAARWSTDHLWAGAELSALLALPPHRWPGYLAPLAFPSREYLHAEGVTWSGRVRRTAHRALAPHRPPADT